MQQSLPGIFLIDKPVGPTSFKMVHLVKRALQIKKVGHTGTLDPFASGLLVICAGREATKIIPQLMEGEKEYAATLKLGVETDTQDLTGTVIRENGLGSLCLAEINDCLRSFVGEQLQNPPHFSALKYNGKPLYYYARKGIKVEKGPRRIFIREIEMLAWENDLLQIRVVCGKGTYIRALAADIGHKLGCGAHLVALRRVRNGRFAVQNALPGEALAYDRQAACDLLLERMLPVEDVIAGCKK
ncbi:MAG: tRNA pseudouridine(55) synthase TruB [Deltaproteobacteria bacterium]|nr:tRNA pseudouridine(55) synthase TruB [Deltaproteobacteria bacterium]